MLGLGLGINRSNIMPIEKIILNPTQDCFVNVWDPDTVYNGSGLEVYNGGIADSLYSLIHFDLTQIIGKTINTATLKLYANDLTQPTTIGIKMVASNWNEETVTYNTRPSIGSTVYYNEAVDVGSNSWKTFNIKTLVQAVADGAMYEGIWMYVTNIVDDYRWCQFCSSEGANVPILEISC